MERRIPISRKQHQMFANSYAVANAAQNEIKVAASAIIAGQDEEIPQANVRGVDDTDGVFTLVLDVPEPPHAE